MNISQSEFVYLKTELTAKIIQILVEENNYTVEDAMSKVYGSRTYELLSDPDSGLFFQSPRYVLSYITSEV
ncbi:MAG: DUF3791 domain-containing protein [Bacteroidales bacterium]|nr:DUF3791 domain-containing protein [Bacteroidales bacterium]